MDRADRAEPGHVLGRKASPVAVVLAGVSSERAPRPEFAVAVAAADADQAGRPVEDALHRAEVVVGDGTQECLELLDRQVADVGVGVLLSRAVGELDRVQSCEAALDGVAVHRRQEPDEVVDGLPGLALTQLGADELLDLLGRDGIEGAAPEVRDQMLGLASCQSHALPRATARPQHTHHLSLADPPFAVPGLMPYQVSRPDRSLRRSSDPVP